MQACVIFFRTFRIRERQLSSFRITVACLGAPIRRHLRGFCATRSSRESSSSRWAGVFTITPIQQLFVVSDKQYQTHISHVRNFRLIAQRQYQQSRQVICSMHQRKVC